MNPRALIAALFAALAVASSSAQAHELTATQERVFKVRLQKSKSVLSWWGGRGKWALFGRHQHCWQIGLTPRHRRICVLARASLRAHRARVVRLERLLAPPPAPAPAAAAVDGCLSVLIERESGWDVHATNPTTGAYGLPQALPGSKMAAAGPDWRDNPRTQIRWMIGYVTGRYGSSCAALSFQTANGYY